MSRSATPATRNEATRRLPFKSDPLLQNLPAGTPWRPRADGCERLRTIANGCERLRTVANGWAASSEHTLNPQTPRPPDPQSETGTFATHPGKTC